MRRRYGEYNGRRRGGTGKTLFLSFLFWAVSGVIMLGFIHGGVSGQMIETKGEDVGKLYIGNVFPTVSRSTDYESREALAVSPGIAAGEPGGILNAGQTKSLFKSMMGSMFPGAEVLDDDLAEEDPGIVYDTGSKSSSDDENTEEGGQSVIDTQNQESSGLKAADLDYTKPVVVIYHTHATESYQPVEEGNFHSLNEYGTVREVGDALTEELKAKGIQVIHDKTIHDSPSYNQSYTRSLETVKKLMGTNGSDMIIIDLHRDAAGYSGNTAKTTTINKNTVAKFSLVIGTGNPNLEALKSFANQVNKTAEEMYPGFGGKIIEKQYKFNQYVSDHHLPLEVGNNQNTIEQAKLTGKYFGDILAKAINDME